MSSISERCTKAQILQAYHDQRLLLQAGPSWPQVGTKVARTGRTASQELVLLVKDCHKAVRSIHRWYAWVVSELTRPIIRSHGDQAWRQFVRDIIA